MSKIDENNSFSLSALKKVMPNIENEIRDNYEKQRRNNQIKGR